MRGPHLHTTGEMACAWLGKIPVVERENGDAMLHQLCYILLMGGNNDGLMNQYAQCVPSKCAEPFETPLMGMSSLDLV